LKRQIQEIGLPKSYSNRIFAASFKVDPELWSRFKGECKLRGVSICHVLEALMEAWIQGQKATATVIKPVTVNLTMQHIVRRPRRMQSFEDAMYHSQNQMWPPPCSKADEFIKSSKEVGCLGAKDWITLDKCWRCYLTMQQP
jgi:hypothetical protein